MTDYEFSNRWFDYNIPVWDQMLGPESPYRPTRILEIGSFEGASTCYIINKMAANRDIELHCVDTWQGGQEHKVEGTDMSEVERRFLHNTAIAVGSQQHKVNLVLHKMTSEQALLQLLAQGRGGYFDLVYVDGSHAAPDVLLDLVLGWQLLSVYGMLVMDDYLWHGGMTQPIDPIKTPKPAIDAFVNINIQKMIVMPYRLFQLYVQKVAV
jgi:predicted O-methyltransferase YrrM